MSQPLNPPTITSDMTISDPRLFLSSTLVAIVTGFALHQVIASIHNKSSDHEHAVRDEARWRRLCETSTIFRNFKGWILAIAAIVETTCPWFIEVPKQKMWLSRWAAFTFQIVFGNPQSLQRALKIHNVVRPWDAREIVACGWIVATIVASSFGTMMLEGHLTWKLILLFAVVWIVSYRAWCWRLIALGNHRRKQIRRFLPHAMDLIAMVMSAGGTFRAGIDTVIVDFPVHPLSEELRRLRNELERGQTLAQAIQSAGECIGLPEFDDMVRILNRVHQHGIPGADSFIRLARQLRTSQLRHMEDEVGRAEASMALPTMLVMLSCMIVAAAPFVLSILTSSFLQ